MTKSERVGLTCLAALLLVAILAARSTGLSSQDIFVQWVTDCINFVLMYVMFRLVVVVPMQEAVQLREQRVKERLTEVDGVLEEARALRRKYEQQMQGLDQELTQVKQAADNTIERTATRIAAQAASEAEYIIERAGHEVNMLRQRAEHEVRQRLASEALARARRLLREHLDAAASRKIVAHAVSRVGELHAP